MEVNNNRDRTSFEIEMYKQAGEEHRHFSDMRFKQLTVLGAISAILVHEWKMDTVSQYTIGICVAMMIITSVLWIMEVRSSLHGIRAWKVTRVIAGDTLKELEETEFEGQRIKDLGSKWRLFNATNAVLCFFILMYCFWFIQFLLSSCPVFDTYCKILVSCVFAILFASLITFSIQEYRPLWKHGSRKSK